MSQPVIFRKRYIPDEIIKLKDDIVLYRDETKLITVWNVLKPRSDFAKGISLYLFDKNWKISKIMGSDNTFKYYYCDIIDTKYDSNRDEYIFTDLLADIVVYDDSTFNVLDLDELADAFEEKLISNDELCLCLRAVNNLIKDIKNGEFMEYISEINRF